MKASEQWKKLNTMVDTSYYIGKKGAEAIEKACEDKPKPAPKKVAKKD